MQDAVAFECVTDYIYNTNVVNFNFFIRKGMHDMLLILLL